jgi:5-(carboxyamino)imidazole ribonucleotide synthase
MARRLGIVGCGQLGQMLGIAARRLGIEVAYLCLDEHPTVAGIGTIYTADTARDFCAAVDAITVERELFDDSLLEYRGELVPLWPPFSALHTIRRRETQKKALDDLDIPTTEWHFVPDREAFARLVPTLNGWWRLKRCLGGYDGLSQWRVEAPGTCLPDVPESAFPAIIEREVELIAELSVVVARDRDGRVVPYPVMTNHAKKAILHWTIVPSLLKPGIGEALTAHAERIVSALGYVGVLAVEAFLTPDGLVINELAPRVHNSGHWTMDGTDCGQFEQHVRAVCGLPLREPTMLSDTVVMVNILGEPPAQVPMFQDVRSYVHLYGKTARPGRKLGHVNLLAPSRQAALEALSAWLEKP